MCKKSLRILTSDLCKNPSYANPYLIFIHAPFPRPIRNAPMTLRFLTWDRSDEGCPSAFHCFVHGTTPPLWHNHFGTIPWQSSWTEVHIHAYLHIHLGHTSALCSQKPRVWQVTMSLGAHSGTRTVCSVTVAGMLIPAVHAMVRHCPLMLLLRRDADARSPSIHNRKARAACYLLEWFSNISGDV